MKITRERAIELGLITCAEDCINCEFCTDCHDTDSAEAINVALKTGYECPSLDEERLRSDMTKEEYDAWRHGRLEWAEEENTAAALRYLCHIPICDTKNIYEVLTAEQKDYIYRMAWFEHVYEDVKGRLLDLDIADEDDAFKNTVAHRYVYEGDYDCNLSYWDNIDNLINECIEQ